MFVFLTMCIPRKNTYFPYAGRSETTPAVFWAIMGHSETTPAMFWASAAHYEKYSSEKHAPHMGNKRFSENAHRYEKYVFFKTCIVLAWTIRFATEMENQRPWPSDGLLEDGQEHNFSSLLANLIVQAHTLHVLKTHVFF